MSVVQDQAHGIRVPWYHGTNGTRVLEYHGTRTKRYHGTMVLEYVPYMVRTHVRTRVRTCVRTYTCTNIITLSQKRLEIQALRCNGDTTS